MDQYEGCSEIYLGSVHPLCPSIAHKENGEGALVMMMQLSSDAVNKIRTFPVLIWRTFHVIEYGEASNKNA